MTIQYISKTNIQASVEGPHNYSSFIPLILASLFRVCRHSLSTLHELLETLLNEPHLHVKLPECKI